MTYTQRRGLAEPTALTCPDCKGTRFNVNYSKVVCTNCGHTEKRGSNKYGAKRTVANDGIKRDSKYEASVADELLMRKNTGDILDYDSQVKIDLKVNGQHVCNYYIDYVVTHKDGTIELLEAKGFETDLWKFKWRILEITHNEIYPNSILTVVKQSANSNWTHSKKR